jgi:predicted transcriptional regulator
MKQMRPPCEVMVLKVLPAIRAEVARIMIQDFELQQQKVADLLGVSKAAVSQYLSSKRGADTDFSDEIKTEIYDYADALNKCEDTSEMIDDFCKICRNIQITGWLRREHAGSSEFICESCSL